LGPNNDNALVWSGMFLTAVHCTYCGYQITWVAGDAILYCNSACKQVNLIYKAHNVSEKLTESEAL